MSTKKMRKWVPGVMPSAEATAAVAAQKHAGTLRHPVGSAVTVEHDKGTRIPAVVVSHHETGLVPFYTLRLLHTGEVVRRCAERVRAAARKR